MLSHHVLSRNRIGRRGAVSIWALACMVLVTALSVTLGRLALSGSRYTLQERRHSQADWLAYSGWSLAMAQLRKNPDYKGETWVVPAAELGGADGGQVTIEVTPATAGEASQFRNVQIVVEFPANSDRKVKVTRRGAWQGPKP